MPNELLGLLKTDVPHVRCKLLFLKVDPLLLLFLYIYRGLVSELGPEGPRIPLRKGSTFAWAIRSTTYSGRVESMIREPKEPAP